jgi:hypothetical protein
MAVERDVTLRVGTKLQGGGDDALRKVGAAANQAGQSTKTLFGSMDQSLKDIVKAVGRLETSIKSMASGASGALRQVRQEADATGKALDRANARGAGAGGIPGAPPSGLVGGFQSGLGAAGGALAALAGAAHAAERGLKVIEQSFDRGAPSIERFRDQITKTLTSLPGGGAVKHLGGASDIAGVLSGITGGLAPKGLIAGALKAGGLDFADRERDIQERERRRAEGQEALARTRERLGIQQTRSEQAAGFGREGAAASARLGLGSQAMGVSAAFGFHNLRAQEAAQGQARGTLGVGRLTQQQDIAARFQFQGGQQQQAVEQEKQLRQLGAERAQGVKDMAKRQAELKDALKQQASAAASASEKGLAGYQVAERQLAVQQAAERVALAQKNVLAEQERAMAQQVQHGDALLAQSQQRVALMTQERDRLAGVAQQERQRLQGAQQEFGGQSPMQRRAALQVARKIAGGGRLSEREFQFAQGAGELFRPAVEKESARRAGPEFEAIKQLLGSGERLKQAEQARVAIENKIGIEIKLNEKGLAEQIQTQLLPELFKAVEQAKAAAGAAQFKADADRKAQALSTAAGF